MLHSQTNSIVFQAGKLDLIGLSNSEDFNLFDYHFRTNNNILLSYKGPFEQANISVMGESIRDILGPFEKAGKKIFKIFIELVQNIGHNSEERNQYCRNQEESGVGSVVLIESPDCFHLVSGNLIKNESVPILQAKCEQINQLDIEGLRGLKREQLELPNSKKGGANIGMIHMAILSEHPLEFTIFEINSAVSFFALSVKVDKQ